MKTNGKSRDVAEGVGMNWPSKNSDLGWLTWDFGRSGA